MLKYLLSSSSGSNEGLTMEVLDIKDEKKCGNSIKILTVDANKPPITARPNGATCSAPSPIPIAIGSIPASMAAAVINTGRKRDDAANRAAFDGFKAICFR